MRVTPDDDNDDDDYDDASVTVYPIDCFIWVDIRNHWETQVCLCPQVLEMNFHGD